MNIELRYILKERSEVFPITQKGEDVTCARRCRGVKIYPRIDTRKIKGGHPCPHLSSIFFLLCSHNGV